MPYFGIFFSILSVFTWCYFHNCRSGSNSQNLCGLHSSADFIFFFSQKLRITFECGLNSSAGCFRRNTVFNYFGKKIQIMWRTLEIFFARVFLNYPIFLLVPIASRYRLKISILFSLRKWNDFSRNTKTKCQKQQDILSEKYLSSLRVFFMHKSTHICIVHHLLHSYLFLFHLRLDVNSIRPKAHKTLRNQ